MGGRGAASGMSTHKNPQPYGSQYRTLLEDGGVKFVTKVKRASEALMESKVPNRVYAVIGGEGDEAHVIYVMFMGPDGKRVAQIDIDKHKHKKKKIHAHHGYEHSEYDGPDGDGPITPEENALVDYALARWEEFKATGR